MGSPGPGEVNIKVEAGPINPAELLLIEGKYASRSPLPARLGIEGVGTITDACIGWQETVDLLGWAHEELGSGKPAAVR